MYTNGSYLAKQVMQVPEELILRKDVSELLPVYMLMYAKYSPFYDLRFYSYTSLSELVELAGTFGKDCQHRRYYNRAADAVEFLEACGVIMTEGYNRAKPTKPFKYRFKDLNEVFGKDEKDGKFGYASLTSNEYFLLLNRVATAYSTGRGTNNLYRIYCYLRLRYRLWQRTYGKEKMGFVATWVGYIKAISKELHLADKTVSNAIRVMYQCGLVIPYYGAIEKGNLESDRPEMILALPLMCGDNMVEKVVCETKNRYRRKPNRAGSNWYPAGQTCGAEDKPEPAEEVMPEPEQETPPEPPMEELCNTQFCDGWEMPPDNYSGWGLCEDEIF